MGSRTAYNQPHGKSRKRWSGIGCHCYLSRDERAAAARSFEVQRDVVAALVSCYLRPLAGLATRDNRSPSFKRLPSISSWFD